MQSTVLLWDHACGHFTISKIRTSASIESLDGDDPKRPEHGCSSSVSAVDCRTMHRPEANVSVVQAGPASSQPSFQPGIEAGRCSTTAVFSDAGNGRLVRNFPVVAPQAPNRTKPTVSFDNRAKMKSSSSFVGLSGGEIFHEMMLRQGVKHMCTSNPLPGGWVYLPVELTWPSWVSWRSYSSRVRRHLQLKPFRVHSTSTRTRRWPYG